MAVIASTPTHPSKLPYSKQSFVVMQGVVEFSFGQIGAGNLFGSENPLDAVRVDFFSFDLDFSLYLGYCT